jgi:ankyrin repeat protein
LRDKEYGVMMKKTSLIIFFILIGSFGWTQNKGTIFYAIEWETVDDVRALIEKGVDVNQPMEDRRTPLHIAAQYSDNPELFRLLLNAGANIDPDGSSNDTPFELILKKDNIELVKLFIDAGVNIQRIDYHGKTPLEYAAMYSKNPEIFRLLISRGATINSGGNGGTPLHSAAGSNKKENVILFINLGANVNARDTKGNTPLMTASRFYASVEALIQAGADINARNNEGKTALILSTQYGGDPKVISLLLQKGANAKFEDNTGRTALDWFDRNRHLSNSPVRKELKDRM